MVVALKSHGGSCCGARHIHGFDSGTEAALDTINAALVQAPTRRAVEVILNGNQVVRYPGVLERLAHLGFVYDGHWKNGNHDSHNYRFTRMDDREPLTLAGWNGMVMDPALTGPLPALPGQTQGGGGGGQQDVNLPHYTRPVPENAARNADERRRTINRAGTVGNGAGIRYEIRSPRSRYHGQTFICLGTGGGFDRNPTYRFRDPVTNNGFEIAQDHCRRAADQGNEPAREPWDCAFVVGDRIQVARSWDRTVYPVGLCGTITRVGVGQVTVQFDPPGYNPINSGLEYLHIVLEGTQPDVPRTRIQPPAQADAPAIGPQRHTVDQNYNRAYPIPAAPAGVPRGEMVVGSRVRRINEQVDGVPIGTLGTVYRLPDDNSARVNWDGGRSTNNYRRNLELVVEAPAPEVREVRVEVPVEPARTMIASTYHCVFRNGTRGAGFDTLEEARASLGRRTRIDRREFFNTAPHMRWVENVPF